MRRGLLGRALIALALVATARPARAHGPAPAVLEVLARDAEGPTWLRSTVGLLRRSPDGSWEHVCPALWDGNDRMRGAVAMDRALVVSSEGWRMPASDRCEPWTILGPVRFAVTDGVRGALYWLSDDPAGLTLWSDEGALGSVPPSIGAVTSMVARDGRAAVAGREGIALWEAGVWATLALPSRLRWVRAIEGEHLYGAAGVDGRSVPERVALADGAVVLGPAADQLLGPVRLGGAVRVLADGEWLEERGDAWEPLGPAQRSWTCLHALHDETSSVVYACSLDGLFELSGEAATPSAEVRFRFTQIGPSPCATCERDWSHYGGEAGWLDTAPATDPEDERMPLGDGGCAAAPTGAGAAPWLLLLALRGRVRRRKRPARRPSTDRPPPRR